MKAHRLWNFLRYWVPVLVWLGLIFIGSTDLMSAEHTSRIIGPILRWLHPTISLAGIAKVQFIVRKAAHVSEYAVLSALIFRAFVRTVWVGRLMLSAAVVLLLCAAYAASDEFHQSFVPSRTASMRDVLIDIGGVILGMMIYGSFPQKRRAKV